MPSGIIGVRKTSITQLGKVSGFEMSPYGLNGFARDIRSRQSFTPANAAVIHHAANDECFVTKPLMRRMSDGLSERNRNMKSGQAVNLHGGKVRAGPRTKKRSVLQRCATIRECVADEVWH